MPGPIEDGEPDDVSYRPHWSARRDRRISMSAMMVNVAFILGKSRGIRLCAIWKRLGWTWHGN